MNVIQEQITDSEIRSDLISAPVKKGFHLRFLKGNSPDLDAVLRLRYRVFNLELQEGLLRSHLSGKGEDVFDRYLRSSCHLPERNGRTCRGLSSPDIRDGAGEYWFLFCQGIRLLAISGSISKAGVEIGRACIAKNHRNIKVLLLLWKGLMKYLGMKEKRFFFGCTSLTGQDPLEGWQVFDYLCTHGFLHPEIFLCAGPDFSCGEYPEAHGFFKKAMIPRLLRAYLNLGQGSAANRRWTLRSALSIFSHFLLWTISMKRLSVSSAVEPTDSEADILGWLRAQVRVFLIFSVLALTYFLILFRRFLPPAAGWRWRKIVFRSWARASAFVLGIRISVRGTPPESPYVIISNHLSYVDIIALATRLDAVFIAKKEVEGWPFLGQVIKAFDCIFIDRDDARSAIRVNREMRRRSKAGNGSCFSPEGTSSAGQAFFLSTRRSLDQPPTGSIQCISSRSSTARSEKKCRLTALFAGGAIWNSCRT